MITKETRNKSVKLTNKSKRYNEILNVMGTDELSAREIVNRLGYHDMNTVRPRLTELVEVGIVGVVGKTYDTLTNREVAVFKKR